MFLARVNLYCTWMDLGLMNVILFELKVNNTHQVPPTRIHWSLAGGSSLPLLTWKLWKLNINLDTPPHHDLVEHAVATLLCFGEWGAEQYDIFVKPIAVIAVSIYHNAMKVGKTYAWVHRQVKQSREDLLRPDGTGCCNGQDVSGFLRWMSPLFWGCFKHHF